MEVVVIITAYKRHLKSLGYAASTIEGYRKGLGQFLRYLESRGIGDIRRVSHRVIRDYQQVVMAEAIAPESKALKLRPVKRLFEHLVAIHRLLINPAEGIVEISRKHRTPGPVLTGDEVKRLMAAPNLTSTTGVRDRSILEVLYATGIRRAELLGLERYDADLAERVLYVRRGKGGGQRVVPLGTSAVAWLARYLKEIRPRYASKKPRERCLLLNRFGAALSAESLYQALRGYRRAAGIEKPVSAHTLRRTCATHLLQAGADIRYIQKLLGHRHLKTTQTYTKIMPVEVKRVHEATHPGKELYANQNDDPCLSEPS